MIAVVILAATGAGMLVMAFWGGPAWFGLLGVALLAGAAVIWERRAKR